MKVEIKNLIEWRAQFQAENDMEVVREMDHNISLFESVSRLFASTESKIYGLIEGLSQMKYFVHLDPSDSTEEIKKEIMQICHEHGIKISIQNN